MDCIKDNYNEDNFLEVLKQISKLFNKFSDIERTKLVIFMDNVAFHKTDKLIEFMKSSGFVYFFNSAYTPHLNICEYTINYIK